MEPETVELVKKKPPRPPLFKVGQKVTTKYNVRTHKKIAIANRRVWLLPGTEWIVTAIEVQEKGRPFYTLRAGEFEIERREHRIRELRS